MNCPYCGSCRQEIIKVVDQLLPNETPLFGTIGLLHVTGLLMICHGCEKKFFIRDEYEAIMEVSKEKS